MENLNLNTIAGQTNVELSGSITIRNVLDLKKEFDALLYNKNLLINLSYISEIDSAGFQLIWLFIEELRKREIGFKVQEISEPLQNILAIYNLELI